MRPRLPNVEELLNHISTEITRASDEPLWISEKHLEYSYGQFKTLRKNKQTLRLCDNRREYEWIL